MKCGLVKARRNLIDELEASSSSKKQKTKSSIVDDIKGKAKNCATSLKNGIKRSKPRNVVKKLTQNNKKVLLREGKRHTARRVVSTPSVVLPGYPPPGGGT